MVTTRNETRAVVAARGGMMTELMERLEAKLPAASDACAAQDDVENEQLRCGRSTQYPRS
jgi:hypothetical protein